jgi:hypothetical protein
MIIGSALCRLRRGDHCGSAQIYLLPKTQQLMANITTTSTVSSCKCPSIKPSSSLIYSLPPAVSRGAFVINTSSDQYQENLPQCSILDQS